MSNEREMENILYLVLSCAIQSLVGDNITTCSEILQISHVMDSVRKGMEEAYCNNNMTEQSKRLVEGVCQKTFDWLIAK